ncbi:MAG: helix-turn-helix transcriptional regulator [Clostridia bacterium]|nr:helix-turn-helix transcriptional regulator [Clostridia bacterium]
MLRKEQKLSQTQLAEKLGLSQDTVSLWELDKALPDVLSVIKMAKIFDVTTDEILCVQV